MRDLKVSRLFVYPLKSAAGIAIDRAELDEFGVRLDRRWMVVDADNQFVTQRKLPRMALIRTSLTAERLRLDAPDMPPLEVPLDPEPVDPAEEVTIWRARITAWPAGPDAARWLGAVLGIECRLVHMPESAGAGTPRFHAGRRLAFTDAYPFLLLTEGSLEGLNRRLESPLPMNRFRPNLVIAGAEPHEEDGWRRIRVGSVELQLVKPCARCSVTTVDQATGEKGVEPLRTLATYRKHDDQVLFGQNAVHEDRGVIRVGDAVNVLERAERDPFGGPIERTESGAG
jgi:uncharacterized protein YcbX